MKNLKHTKTLVEKIQIKGVLSDDGKKILVTDKDEEFEVTLQDYIDTFRGEYLELTFSTKQEEDLSEEM